MTRETPATSAIKLPWLIGEVPHAWQCSLPEGALALPGLAPSALDSPLHPLPLSPTLSPRSPASHAASRDLCPHVLSASPAPTRILLT
eukprot:2662808-Rhodomonas_salina.1